MKALVANIDVYRWVDEKGVLREANRGDTIDVSQDEFDRAQEMGNDLAGPALVKPGSKDAKAAAAGDVTPDQPLETPGAEPVDEPRTPDQPPTAG